MGFRIGAQILIVDYKLIFPSGMATAVLINGFHTQGDKMAKYLLRIMFKFSFNMFGICMCKSILLNFMALQEAS